jgi:endonuclease YncB( thermonuclease family)
MIKDLIAITLLTWLIEKIADTIGAAFKAIAWIVTAPFKLIGLVLNKTVNRPPDIEGKVKRVIDGDSLLVDTQEGLKEVRIKGIDAPEHGQAGFGPAKRAAERIMLGHPVILKDGEIDNYGRIAAKVEIAATEVDTAETLVEQGVAFPDPRGTTRKIKAAAKEPKRERKGVWDGKEPTPWEFREMNGM